MGEKSKYSRTNHIDMNIVEFTWSQACSLTLFLIICLFRLFTLLWCAVCGTSVFLPLCDCGCDCCRCYGAASSSFVAFIQSKSITMLRRWHRRRSHSLFAFIAKVRYILYFLLGLHVCFFVFVVQFRGSRKQVNSTRRVQSTFSLCLVLYETWALVARCRLICAAFFFTSVDPSLNSIIQYAALHWARINICVCVCLCMLRMQMI